MSKFLHEAGAKTVAIPHVFSENSQSKNLKVSSFSHHNDNEDKYYTRLG